MKNKAIKLSSVAASIILATTTTSTVNASGFRIPELSTVGTATSNALVANTDETGAMAYNSAAMAFHKGNIFQFGVNHIGYDLEVNPENGVPASTNTKDSFLVPNLYLSSQMNEKWTFGFAINSPYGLETGYPAGTFQTFADVATATATPAIAGLEPARSKIKMVNINPNVAYMVGKNTSIGFGVNIYDVANLVFNSQSTSINGAGTGLGYNFGILSKVGKFNLGLSYRSSVTADLDGNVSVLPATASVEFPSVLQLGVLYNITDNWVVELDAEQTGWSSFDKLVINYPAATSPITSTNNWKDEWAYRLSTIYNINERLKIMFGYSMDKTPQPDDYFSARIPDNDRQLFSTGITYDFGSWSIEASYMYVDVDDRTFNSSRTYLSEVVGGNTDPNGTDAYNGTYKSSVNLIGLGFSTKF